MKSGAKSQWRCLGQLWKGIRPAQVDKPLDSSVSFSIPVFLGVGELQVR